MTKKELASYMIASLLRSKKKFNLQRYGKQCNEDHIIERSRLLLDIADEYEDPEIEGFGMWNLYSEEIDDMYLRPRYIEDWINTGQALGPKNGDRKFTINVFAKNGAADLHHDSGYVLSYLVTGSKLWFVYPPTDENMTIMREVYEMEPPENSLKFFTVFQRLQGGIVVLQEEGTTLWQPPLCPHAVFTLSSSCLMGGELYIASDFPARLRNIGLESTFAICNGSTCTAELDEIFLHLRMALEITPTTAYIDHISAISKRTLLRKDILKAWDSIDKDDIRGMIAKSKKHKENDFTAIWADALVAWQHCPVCNVKIVGEGRRNVGAKAVAKKHVMENHWKDRVLYESESEGE